MRGWKSWKNGKGGMRGWKSWEIPEFSNPRNRSKILLQKFQAGAAAPAGKKIQRGKSESFWELGFFFPRQEFSLELLAGLRSCFSLLDNSQFFQRSGNAESSSGKKLLGKGSNSLGILWEFQVFPALQGKWEGGRRKTHPKYFPGEYPAGAAFPGSSPLFFFFFSSPAPQIIGKLGKSRDANLKFPIPTF